jgi:phosphate/phosphite/phosphonate ABC transporter binding protein
MTGALTFATGPVQLDDDGAHLRRELGRSLADALGVDVEVVAEPSYAALGDRVARGEAAIAWLPPATFVRAADSGAIERVYCAERSGGARYQSALFVRAESRFDAPESLAGMRVAWVDRDSCAGYLFPRLELVQRGQPPETLFSEQRFLVSHRRVVCAVQAGEVEAGATFVQVRSDPARPSRPPGAAEARDDLAGSLALVGWAPFVAPAAMRAVLVSRAIPSDAVCVTRALPPALRDAVGNLLEVAGERPRLQRLFRGLMNADRFVRAEPSSYDAVREAMRGAPA